ncbi:MAG: DUF928 domain-containing protein [Cyanobacteria bacterium P01_G01_bin.38]
MQFISKLKTAKVLRSASAAGLTLMALLSPSPATANSSNVLFNAPPPPSGLGAPTGRRDGGASRGNCPDYGNLAALVPIVEGTVWGQTTTAQPTLWFYLPATVTPEQPIELVVQAANDDVLYMTTLAVDAAAGNIAIALPKTITLPIGEPHYWTLALYCDPEQPASSVFVSGTIERVAADGVEPLLADTVPSLSLAQDYANAGVWHDALTILGALQQSGPASSDSQMLWTALLEQVGLAAAATAPIQPCCEAE